MRVFAHTSFVTLLAAQAQCLGDVGLSTSLSNNGIVSPSSPSVNIDVYAITGEPWFAFSTALFGYWATESGAAEPHYRLLPADGIPGFPPSWFVAVTPQTNGWLANVGQSNTVSHPANPASPLLIMSFEWETSDFTPRTVEIHMGAADWWIYETSSSQAPVFTPPPNNIVLQIQVIPAPSSALALFGGASVLGARRRRR
ncbi:MAG: PEP-CTERM sorting domain-containing protein [Phycisphaeraceae bacterium]|nr:PEP-CTERM sorting domain-containing protein [Phycisphaerales bacterium]MCB9860055.1 PEP-CTERM sorting domain-containing protein [Phycisphaeraceae bacterium]